MCAWGWIWCHSYSTHGSGGISSHCCREFLVRGWGIGFKIPWIGSHMCMVCVVMVGVAGTVFCSVEVRLAWLQYMILSWWVSLGK